MNAKIEELKVRPDLKIKKGSIVSLDFDVDGRVIEADVTGIFMRDNKIFIESSTCNYSCPMTHSDWQYRRSAKLIKF